MSRKNLVDGAKIILLLGFKDNYVVNRIYQNNISHNWHNVLKKYICTFTNMKKYFVPKVVNSRSKSLIELLSLEIGYIPKEYISLLVAGQLP